MHEILKGNIDAVIPIYTDTGANFTKIISSDGNVVIENPIGTVLKKICNYYHHDLKASNSEYRKRLKIHKLPPIPLTGRLTFIAIKTRVPFGKNDGAYSYINIENVKKVEGDIIFFKDGNTLKTLYSEFTIERKRFKGAFLKNEALKKYN